MTSPILFRWVVETLVGPPIFLRVPTWSPSHSSAIGKLITQQWKKIGLPSKIKCFNTLCLHHTLSYNHTQKSSWMTTTVAKSTETSVPLSSTDFLDPLKYPWIHWKIKIPSFLIYFFFLWFESSASSRKVPLGQGLQVEEVLPKSG